MIYADSFFKQSPSKNSIQTAYIVDHHYSNEDSKQRISWIDRGFKFASNYSQNSVEIDFLYVKPDFDATYQNKTDSYLIQRKFGAHFFRVNTRVHISKQTKLNAKYNYLDQSVYSFGIEQRIAHYNLTLDYSHSDRFIELIAEGDLGSNQLIIPIGYSSIKASIETDQNTISYENRGFDQDINRTIRHYSNAGRQHELTFFSKRYKLKLNYLLTNLTLRAKQSNQLFLKLDQFRFEQITLSKFFPFKRWKLNVFYQISSSRLDGPDSFADAWPFNVFDFLTSDRLRLQTFNNTIKTIGLTSYRDFHIGSSQITGRLDYEHYLTEGSLAYGNRFYILFPVLTDYDNKNTNLESSIDATIRIEVNLSYHFEDFKVNLKASQLIPIDYSRINRRNSSSSTPEKTSQFGGLRSQLSLTYFFK